MGFSDLFDFLEIINSGGFLGSAAVPDNSLVYTVLVYIVTCCNYNTLYLLAVMDG